MGQTPSWEILRFHEETKHHPHRYARSQGFLDWETQPNPFRIYEGVTPLLLPLLREDPAGQHLDLYEREHNPCWDFHLESIAGFLELSMGLSAWKSLSGGNKWALRMNPSSGNLHPTEAHLILPPVEGQQGGVYHYNPYAHALEPRASLPIDFSSRIQSHFLSTGFLIGLTSIFWRESWKYGERALRYCYHDTGHALAALSFAANLFGWKLTLLGSLSEFDISTLFGLAGTAWPEFEEEYPECLCFVSPSASKAIPRGIPPDLLRAFSTLPFSGNPNKLSKDHVDWKIIRTAAQAARKPRAPEGSVRYASQALVRHPVSSKAASTLIRERRSAVAFDGLTTMTQEQFVAMLDKTLPRNGVAPFDAEIGDTFVHLLIFVHRVIGMESGLYFLVRNAEHLPDLKRSFHREFEWFACKGVPLFRLKTGNYQQEAARISCLQTIAGRSAFAIGMVARFASTIERSPWLYPTLFWETGMIGQVLYLEAEAQGVRGTGIGCFFDDEVHRLLGLRDHSYQSLYHFTVGGAVEDTRLTTERPYHHLPADRK